MGEPLISVLVPLFNAREFIEECLHSIQRQSYMNFEVIVCDNGSKDDSLAVAREAVAGDLRFIFLSEPEPGIHRALGRALSVSRGEWITFLDNDDRYHPNRLEKTLQAVLEAGAVMGVCRARRINREGRPILGGDGSVSHTRRLDFMPAILPHLLSQYNHFNTLSNMLVHRRTLEARLPFPAEANLALDYYLALNVVGAGEPLVMITESLVDRRFHEKNVSRRYADMVVQVLPMLVAYDRQRPVLHPDIHRRVRTEIYVKAVQHLRRTGQVERIPGFFQEYLGTQIDSALYGFFQMAAQFHLKGADSVIFWSGDHPLADFMRGMVHGDVKDAAGWFLKAWKGSCGHFPEAANNWSVRMAASDPVGARQMLFEALKVKPSYMDALVNLHYLESAQLQSMKQTFWLSPPTLNHFIYHEAGMTLKPPDGET